MIKIIVYMIEYEKLINFIFKGEFMKREKWIDIGKFIAIFGVVLDHTAPILGEDKFHDPIKSSSFYSVTLFIILAGITLYMSFENSNRQNFPINYLFKKSKVILIPYIVATIIFCVYKESYFYFETILNRLIYFNAAIHLYYVFLYLQLLCISPILYKIIKNINSSKHSLLKHILFLTIIMFLSIVFTKYTNILNIYGGGGKLLGGTFLTLYYFGMLFASKILYKPRKKAWLKSFIFFTLFLFLITAIIKTDRMILDFDVFFQETMNPANITLSMYGLLIFFFIFYFFTTLEMTKHFSKLISILAWLGKYSLYIFLYHLFVQDILFIFIETLHLNPRLEFSIAMLCSLMFPVIFYNFFLKIKNIFLNTIWNKTYN